MAMLSEEGVRSSWTPPDWGGTVDVDTAHPTSHPHWSLEQGTHTQFGVEVTIDEYGLRSGPLDTIEPTWLVLGDSSFFGHGLTDPETLHAKLSTQLNQLGIKRSVKCGGVPGYSDSPECHPSR